MQRNQVRYALISIISIALLGIAGSGFAQAPTGAPPAEGRGGRGAGRGAGRGPAATIPPIFFKENFQRPANEPGQVPVKPTNLTNPNLELKVYGADAKNLTISGVADNTTGPINPWTGMS